VATYDTKTSEGAYLAGIVAGGMSKTRHRKGGIGAHPQGGA
jgi:basic membrane lipoprotein Med (substrate-binding protein (PBP1-ABC) superfamily)